MKTVTCDRCGVVVTKHYILTIRNERAGYDSETVFDTYDLCKTCMEEIKISLKTVSA